MGKKVIITGATGMVGGLVLEQCLNSNEVMEVISLGRRKSGKTHGKLHELIVEDFLNLDQCEPYFDSIDIVYYCLGAYDQVVDRELFRKITIDYPETLAKALIKKNPACSFCLLSEAGADRSEETWVTFAKDKGTIENRLSNIGFRSFHAFRPLYIYPFSKRKEPDGAYTIKRFFYPVVTFFFRNISIKSNELAQVMFEVGLNGFEKETLENKDIIKVLRSRVSN